MRDWLPILVIVGAAALVGVLLGRIWFVLVGLPPVFGALAWYGWEFDSVAGVLALGIVVLGYIGLAIGLALRRPWRRARRSLRKLEL